MTSSLVNSAAEFFSYNCPCGGKYESTFKFLIAEWDSPELIGLPRQKHVCLNVLFQNKKENDLRIQVLKLIYSHSHALKNLPMRLLVIFQQMVYLLNNHQATKEVKAVIHFALGEWCRLGLGTEQSWAKAFGHYSLSAEFGYPDAALMLGYMYQFGQVAAKCSKTSFEIFKKAASMKCIPAIFKIGLYYEMSIDASFDIDLAKRYYRYASARGHVPATVRLAVLNMYPNFDDIHQLVQGFVSTKHPRCLSYIAHRLSNQLNKINKEDQILNAKFAMIQNAAASQGDPFCSSSLGHCLLSEKSQNYENGLRYIQSSALQDHAIAQKFLAKYYIEYEKTEKLAEIWKKVTNSPRLWKSAYSSKDCKVPITPAFSDHIKLKWQRENPKYALGEVQPLSSYIPYTIALDCFNGSPKVSSSTKEAQNKYKFEQITVATSLKQRFFHNFLNEFFVIEHQGYSNIKEFIESLKLNIHEFMAIDFSKPSSTTSTGTKNSNSETEKTNQSQTKSKFPFLTVNPSSVFEKATNRNYMSHVLGQMSQIQEAFSLLLGYDLPNAASKFLSVLTSDHNCLNLLDDRFRLVLNFVIQGLLSRSSSLSVEAVLIDVIANMHHYPQELAIGRLDQALKEFPCSTDLLFYKGCFLSQLGQFRKAAICFEKCMNLNSSNPDFYFHRGVACSCIHTRRHLNDALSHFERYLELTESKGLRTVDAKFCLAKSYFILGRKERFVQTFTEAVKMEYVYSGLGYPLMLYSFIKEELLHDLKYYLAFDELRRIDWPYLNDTTFEYMDCSAKLEIFLKTNMKGLRIRQTIKSSKEYFNRCHVCHLPSRLLCGGCQNRKYCSVRCQMISWSTFKHSNVCHLPIVKFQPVLKAKNDKN